MTLGLNTFAVWRMAINLKLTNTGYVTLVLELAELFSAVAAFPSAVGVTDVCWGYSSEVFGENE